MPIIRWMTMLMVLVSGCGVLGIMLVPEAPPKTRGDEPPALYFLQGDVAFPMDRGSSCWGMGQGGLCRDIFLSDYTPEAHTLVIGPTLELRFDAPLPDTLNVALRPGSSLMSRIADSPVEAEMDANGGVLVTIPDNVEGRYILTVFATWTFADGQHGDSFYTAPVRFGE
jgi:hypothetical protein